LRFVVIAGRAADLKGGGPRYDYVSGTQSTSCAGRGACTNDMHTERTIPNARLDIEFQVARMYITGRARIETLQFPPR
jgi:hypothetical protein